MTFLTAVLESAYNSLAIVLKQSYWSWLTLESVTYITSNTITVHYSHFPLQLFSGWWRLSAYFSHEPTYLGFNPCCAFV